MIKTYPFWKYLRQYYIAFGIGLAGLWFLTLVLPFPEPSSTWLSTAIANFIVDPFLIALFGKDIWYESLEANK